MHSYFADTTVHYKVLSYKSPIIQKDHVKTVVHSHMVLYAFFLSVYTIFLRIFKVKLVSLLPAISFLYKIRKQFRS